MKFSLFYEMQIADPTRATEQDMFQQAVKQAVLAEKLGYHCIWNVEHHGLYEYSHSSAPEVFLTYVAAKTSTIRLGHGVTLTPRSFNHPIRVAERVATLDILSNGRVNWASGKSSSIVEGPLFEIERKDLSPQWHEALHMVPQMWKDAPFSWQSDYFNIPPTQIHPKPMQQPTPPVFVSGVQPEAIQNAATLGVGVLCFTSSDKKTLADKIQLYRDTIAKAQPEHWRKNDHFALAALTCVLDDDLEACRHGYKGVRFFRDSLGQYYGTEKPPQPGTLNIPRSDLSNAEVETWQRQRFETDKILEAIIGDPAIAREKVQILADLGVDELILVMQLGTIPQDVIERSIICFAEKVMNHFRD
ncbi:LLM class flavin-dependent oxidoreductase [Rhizobium helianthi]|uniref:LLM class flavin-dependent oxidoreductase n=1 Tax=Rhizobium helianthi TaxID=1132695 RepID=A0ABW4M4I6_9HYPH